MIGLAPIHIKPLLELHCFPLTQDQHYVTEKILDELLAMELIEKRKESGPGYSVYTTSSRGRVYVDGLCRVPLPEQVWHLPHNPVVPAQTRRGRGN